MPAPAGGSVISDDARFTTGLWLDVRQVLVDHGYPGAAAPECLEIRQALFRLLYRDTTLGTRAADAGGDEHLFGLS